MDLAKSFGALTTPAEAQPDQAQPTPAPPRKSAAPRKPARSTHQAVAAAPATKAWTRGEGKSSNPDYGRMTVYVPKQLRTRAERKWEDDTGKDASDLVEHLLTEYLDT